MSLRWPEFLLLLGIVPLLLAAYLWMLRRRRRFAVRYSSLSLVRVALGRQSQWRRHLPFALLLAALASLALALTRPVAVVIVPTNETSILLAIDVSRSMCASDIPPNRLEAAKAAALEFIRRQEPGTKIGIVAFARFAAVIQPPTTDQEALENAIDHLTTGRGTAIGSGLLMALDAIAEINPNVAPSISETGLEPTPQPVPEGAYVPEIIVILTDGVTTDGIDPLEAAEQAVVRGVRVYTIGFGTANPQGNWGCGGGGQFGRGRPQQFDSTGSGAGGGGGGFRRGIDEATLEQVADLTGGKYYAAASAGELQSVFADLPRYFSTREEEHELSVIFTAIGALLAALATGLALRWNPLP